MTNTQEAFDRLTGIDSTELGKSIAALAAIPPPPEPMARVILDVPIRELKYTPQGEDFPLVQWYGFDVEVTDEDYELVSDHYNEWLAGRHE